MKQVVQNLRGEVRLTGVRAGAPAGRRPRARFAPC